MDETEAEKRERLRDERILKDLFEAKKLEEDYKRATILLAKQLPVLIDELILLRGAINRRS